MNFRGSTKHHWRGYEQISNQFSSHTAIIPVHFGKFVALNKQVFVFLAYYAVRNCFCQSKIFLVGISCDHGWRWDPLLVVCFWSPCMWLGTFWSRICQTLNCTVICFFVCTGTCTSRGFFFLRVLQVFDLVRSHTGSASARGKKHRFNAISLFCVKISECEKALISNQLYILVASVSEKHAEFPKQLCLPSCHEHVVQQTSV